MKNYKYHYVYRITNVVTGYHYYGSKSCNENPTENIGKKYYSSSSNKLFIQDQKNNPGDYKYKVIKIFESCREDAVELEIKLHAKFDVKKHTMFINKANQTSKKFDTTGISYNKNKMVVYDANEGKHISIKVEDYKDKIGLINNFAGKIHVINCETSMSETITQNEYNMNKNKYKLLTVASGKVAIIENGETSLIDKNIYDANKHTSVSKGKVPVKDKNGQIMLISTNTYDSNHHKYLTNGMTVGKHNYTGELKYMSVDELKVSKTFEHFNKGSMTAIDIRTNTIVKVSKEDYSRYDYYVNMNSKLIKIFNNVDKHLYSCFGNFKAFCEQNDLPYEAFRKSYACDGKPLYLNPGKKENQLKSLGYLKYRGWYAIKE